MEHKKISFFWALFPILVLIALLATNVYLYGDDSLGGANQLTLLLTARTELFEKNRVYKT